MNVLFFFLFFFFQIKQFLSLLVMLEIEVADRVNYFSKNVDFLLTVDTSL